MVKLLIGLICKESHVLIWKFIKWPNRYKIKTFGRPFIIEYIAVGLCYAQILWMKQTLCDFDLSFEHVPIKCDNTSAINI